MLKNILRIVLNVLIVVLLFVLQLYVFNKLYIFGARFNVIAIYCIIISMLNMFKVSLPISLVIGVITDVVLCSGRLQYFLIFPIIAIVFECLKKIYKQDNSKSIVIYALAGIIVLEIVSVIFSVIRTGISINIFAYVVFVFKQLAINVVLAYGMYIIAAKMNNKMEI